MQSTTLQDAYTHSGTPLVEIPLRNTTRKNGIQGALKALTQNLCPKHGKITNGAVHWPLLFFERRHAQIQCSINELLDARMREMDPSSQV